MEKDRDNTRLLDYLYGEMSAAEKAAFGKELQNDEELAQELNELRGVQDALGSLEDKEVVPPSFIFNDEKPKTVPFAQSDAFRWVGSIAAGLAILLVSAYVLNFHVATNESGVQLGFGQPQIASSNQVNKEDVQSWMKEVMADYDANTSAQLVSLEDKLTSKIDSQDQENLASMQKLMSGYSSETDQLMRAYVAQVSDGNKKMIEDFFVVSNETQQQYMQSVLADFNEFYQNQRSYDLKVIETSIDMLKNNYDVQQLEQDNLLANLYDMVQTQSK